MNAVITGASRGMGKATAKIFAMHGYNLYLTARTESTLFQSVEELKTEFPTITINAKAFDLGNKQQAQLFGQWIVNEADIIDVLVNNTGSYVPGNISVSYTHSPSPRD